MANPQQLELKFRSAVKKFENGDFSAAEKALLKILKSVPNDPNVLHLMMVVSLQLGCAEKAIRYGHKLETTNPGLPDLYNLLGTAYRLGGQTKKALSAFRSAVGRQPKSADIHFNFANALRDNDELEDANEHYQRSFQLDGAVV